MSMTIRSSVWAIALAFALLPAQAALAAGDWWTEESTYLGRPIAGTEELPAAYRTFRIDAEGFRLATDSAPQSLEGIDRGIELSLPTPDGGAMRFRVVESPILSPALQAYRPDIATYLGVGIDDPRARVRLGIAGDEFHARVRRTEAESFTVAGLPGLAAQSVLAWYDRDGAPRAFDCLTDVESIDTEFADASEVLGRRLGNLLRTYDLAVTTPGELTQFIGSIAAAENMITSVVNILNNTYEVELAVTFQIVDFNCYPDPNTDPFPTGTILDGDLINQNNAALNLKLGSTGYDVGHVLGYTPASGAYGLAYVGSQCRSNVQGGAGTFAANLSASNLAGVMLHEVGHQLGATHSFNSTVGGCEGNRSGTSAYEIGSGVTIMSYAGLCGSENVVNTDIDMFNSGALQQITTRINSSQSCGSGVSTGNAIPSVDAGPNLTIPRSTAFVLEGSAVDPDGDPMTYSWEQHDLGFSTPPYDPGNGPTFRNFAPVSTPVRSLPEYAFYRVNFIRTFDKLPTVDRTLTFRFIVRDNDPVSGATAWDTKVLTVSGDPFTITTPNGGESYAAGSTVSLEWNVGGGSVAADVRVLESNDDGNTWSEVIASTPNDGQVDVQIPCAVTSSARFRIEAIDNVFFDISNASFSVTADTSVPVVGCPASATFVAPDANGLPKTDAQFVDFIASISATDNCDTDLTILEFAPPVLPIGVTNVAITYTDDSGNLAVCVVPVTVEQATSAPGLVRTALLGAVPNPFNPRTTIAFDLARAQNVKLEVIDVRGRRVAVLAESSFGPGRHQVDWQGVDADGTQAPSGVYFLKLTTDEGVFTDRVALLK